MIQEIVVGVASGVMSAILIIVAGVVIQRIVIPWYRAITYSGVDISGEWHCIDPSMAQEITFNLTQQANTINGAATFTWDHDDTDRQPREFEVVRSFKVSGFVQDRFVQLTLRHINPKRIGINGYLLEVCGDGRKMEGIFSFYSVRSNIMDSSRHLLFRDRSLAEQIAGPEIKRRKQRRLELLEQLREIELEGDDVHEGYLDPELEEVSSESEEPSGKNDT